MLSVLAAVGMISLLLALPQLSRTTLASWTNSEYGKGTFTASSVRPPRNLSCSANVISGRVTFSWLTPTTGGATRSGYSWAVSGLFTRSGALAAGATSVVIDVPTLGLGTANFTVWAVSNVATPEWQSTKLAGRIYVLTGLIPDCSVP